MHGGIVEQVVGAIAEAEGKQPDELRFPLQEHVDVDAIRLLATHESTSWTLEFDVPNHSIRVTGQGVILVDGVRREPCATEC